MLKIIFVFLLISANVCFAASNLNFTSLGVGGGMNGTDWSSTSYFTFTNLGTVSGDNKFCRRVGDSLHCRGTVIQGSAVASVASIDLSSLTIALSKHSTSAAGQIVGTYNATDDSSTNDLYGTSLRSGVIFIDGSDNNSLFFANRNSTSGLTKVVNGVVNNNQEFSYDFTIPISGWTSGGSGTTFSVVSVKFGGATEGVSECSASPCTKHTGSSSCIGTVTRNSTGSFSIDVSGCGFANRPACVAAPYYDSFASIFSLVVSATSTSNVNVRARDSGGSPLDVSASVICTSN